MIEKIKEKEFSGESDLDRFAPEGKLWICMACGKISPHDRFGLDLSEHQWDASCVLRSELITQEEYEALKKGTKDE